MSVGVTLTWLFLSLKMSFYLRLADSVLLKDISLVLFIYYTLKFIIYPFDHDFTFFGFIYLQLVRLLFCCWKKKSDSIC